MSKTEKARECEKEREFWQQSLTIANSVVVPCGITKKVLLLPQQLVISLKYIGIFTKKPTNFQIFRRLIFGLNATPEKGHQESESPDS